MISLVLRSLGALCFSLVVLIVALNAMNDIGTPKVHTGFPIEFSLYDGDYFQTNMDADHTAQNTAYFILDNGVNTSIRPTGSGAQNNYFVTQGEITKGRWEANGYVDIWLEAEGLEVVVYRAPSTIVRNNAVAILLLGLTVMMILMLFFFLLDPDHIQKMIKTE